MAAKILFTHSYFYRLDKKQWQSQRPYPPYGTILAAANARIMGHQVSLFDSALQFGPEQILPQLQTFQPDFLVIYDDSFNYLSKMCLSVMRDAALKMIGMAREKGITVLVSSSDATDHPENYLQAGAAIVMLGEADQTLAELLLKSGQASPDCLGIAYLENGSLLTTSRRPVLQDLDSLPAPAWDLISLDDYRDIWMRAHGYFSLNIATTRGCPFKCNWCAKPMDNWFLQQTKTRWQKRFPKHLFENGSRNLMIGKHVAKVHFTGHFDKIIQRWNNHLEGFGKKQQRILRA